MAADPPKGLPPGTDPIGANLFDGTFPLPTAVLDAAALSHNLTTMAGYCAAHGVLLAPHGKTTMSPQLIGRQLDLGAWAVTAATAWQAGVLASSGVPRILIANQVVDAGSLALLDRLLAGRADIEVYCYADSPEALAALLGGLAPARLARLRVLVELGVTGGRTGLRDDGQALALARRIAAGPAVLAGVAAFEGIIDEPDLAAGLARVDTLLGRVAGLCGAIDAAGLAGTEPIATVGGSAYFDRVVRLLPRALAGTAFRTVLRSGCYVTHDAGSYHALSPFGAGGREAPRLREALHVWAPVLSRPEPGLAIAGLGRRDASADAGLPVPQMRRTPGGGCEPLASTVVTAVNDQHAYLAVPPSTALAVSDLVRFGISHPCTTFDKWRAIPVVDPDGTVVDVARTSF
ncbi:alanine racemase [Phytohabitans houttuyneae]|uniref:Amino acid deaminase n=1 Tax=Phytohabitans houttuyneae TaxID=1076126 RepID=A0A6V8KNR7_9ACTN|nr:alanine racemase [Phytohabitans houttuyneae]GFJ83526.1 amino acid deaminase [Phytohabitans houttuyneae]